LIGGALLLGSQLPTATAADDQTPASSAAWRQWGGPSRDFTVRSSGLADSWPEGGPRTIWSRPLGPGHSSILFDAGLLFTMYRVGNGRARQGPWDAAESVIALDAATGKTIWEHKYASKIEDFSYGAGPHSTPLIVGDRLLRSARTSSSSRSTRRAARFSGRTISSRSWTPVAVDSAGGESGLWLQSDRLRRHDHLLGRRAGAVGGRVPPGRRRRRLEERTLSGVGSGPILITVDGRRQLVVFGGGAVHGLNPATGAVLWSHPHDPGNDLNINTPIFSDTDNILLLSSAYKGAGRADPSSNRMAMSPKRRSSGSAIASGTCFSVRSVSVTTLTARPETWTLFPDGAQHHRPVRWSGSIAGSPREHAVRGRQAILLEEDGDLVMARLTPEGSPSLAQSNTLRHDVHGPRRRSSGRRSNARDREKIVAHRPRRAANEVIDSVREVRAPVPPATRALTTDLSGTWKLDRHAARSPRRRYPD
jgi:hypothetical protein